MVTGWRRPEQEQEPGMGGQEEQAQPTALGNPHMLPSASPQVRETFVSGPEAVPRGQTFPHLALDLREDPSGGPALPQLWGAGGGWRPCLWQPAGQHAFTLVPQCRVAVGRTVDSLSCRVPPRRSLLRPWLPGSCPACQGWLLAAPCRSSCPVHKCTCSPAALCPCGLLIRWVCFPSLVLRKAASGARCT